MAIARTLLKKAGMSVLFVFVLIAAFAVGTVISAIFLKAVEL